MSDRVRKILKTVLALVFLVSTVFLFINGQEKQSANESYHQAQEIAGLTEDAVVPAPTEALEPAVTEPAAEILPEETLPQTMWVPVQVEPDEYMIKLEGTNLDALREVNPDVVGWIFLPASQVNYPIVQGEDNRYYLEHTWDNQKNYAGSIFLEATNSGDLSDCRSILYGHNMANMSMFAVLHYYANAWYTQTYPYVYLVTDEGILRYEIYSTYNASVDSKTYALNLDQRMMASFIRMTLEASELDLGIVPADTDRILTLSTCTGNYETRRVVHARLAMEEVEIKNDSPQEKTCSESQMKHYGTQMPGVKG